jgi:(2R)-ethylmalonyl-CoA mutase
MKGRLVEANAARIAAIEAGVTTVVGVNRYAEGAPSPLTAGDGAIMEADPKAEADQIERLNAWRASRDDATVARARKELGAAAREGRNIMPASLACAEAGVTTGEWGAAMREVFGEYRGPTGVAAARSNKTHGLDDIRAAVDAVSTRLGERLRLLVGKPGLDGHSNGAEQIAARARDAGIDMTYEGIRLTPAEIVAAAQETRPHVVGLSILSGSHLALLEDLMARMRDAGLADTPVVVGGIIPDADAAHLLEMGVARVYTPKDFELNRIMFDIVALADPRAVAAE